MSMVMAAIACGKSDVTDLPIPIDDSDTYWGLMFRDRAINLSLEESSNSVQLSVIPVTAQGKPYTQDIGTPVYSIIDTARVSVTTDGRLTAKEVATGVIVTAKMQINGVTHWDTAIVNITSTMPTSPIVTFSIQPILSDSAISSPGTGKVINPSITNSDGRSIRNLSLCYQSSQPRIMYIDRRTGSLEAITQGRTMITVSSYYYGTRLKDSIEYVSGYPTMILMTITDRVMETGITSQPIISVGGTVLWLGIQEHSGAFRFTFDTPLDALPGFPFDMTEGNIDSIGAGQARARTFTRPGKHRYTDTQGRTQTIMVKSNSEL